MKILTVEPKNNFINFKVELTKKELANLETKILEEFSKQIKINSFRKGHVPLSIVKKHVSEPELYNKIVNRDISNIAKFIEVSKEYGQIDKVITGQYTFTLAEINEDNIVIWFSYEEYPEITVGDYRKIEIPFADFTVTDAEVDQQLEFFQKSLATFTPLKEDEKINQTDLVNVDIKFSVPDQQQHKVKAVELEVKPNHPRLFNFDKHIVGKKVNETFQYEITFPEDYFIKEYANKKGQIEFKINKASHVNIPALSDQLIKERFESTEINTISTFKAFVKKQIEESKYRNYQKTNLPKIYQSLINLSKINFYPELLIYREMPNRLQIIDMNLRKQGTNLKKYLQQTKISNEQFQKNVFEEIKASFLVEAILAEIGEKEKIEVTESELQKELEILAKNEKTTVPELQKRIDMEKFINALNNEKIIKKLIEWNMPKNKK